MVTFTLLWWSENEPTISLRYLCNSKWNKILDFPTLHIIGRLKQRETKKTMKQWKKEDIYWTLRNAMKKISWIELIENNRILSMAKTTFERKNSKAMLKEWQLRGKMTKEESDIWKSGWGVIHAEKGGSAWVMRFQLIWKE